MRIAKENIKNNKASFCREFSACTFLSWGYNSPRIGRLAQLVRALRLHRRGRGFESLSAHLEAILYDFKLAFFIFTHWCVYLNCNQFGLLLSTKSLI
jgi:hypothetical protein